ncbi:MAG: endonuclease III [Myxococcota bacterium]|nr:endonuclease III [Myxococcota bacterium]
MNRAEKAQRIQALLDELYPETPIPLDHADPYTLLVAVMLSAQTTDKKVNEVTPGLFALADTPAAMAEVSVETIQNAIRTVGLAPTKARNLKNLSIDLRDTHGGVVPESFEALEALPGVGHKTASVVMSQAFGVPAFPVDTHIHRLAARWGLSSGKNVERTEADLKRTFPRDSWNKLHLQIIFFGRQHCPARGHDLTTCPICGWAASKKRVAAEAKKLSVRAGRRGPRGT